MGFLSKIGNIVGAIAGGGNTISALTTAGGYLADRSETRHSAKQQYEYNNALQNNNIAFQREMAQNKIQYAVQDALKSGLNPAIGLGESGTGGAGASQSTSAGNTSNSALTALNDFNSQRIADATQRSQAELNAALTNSEIVKQGLLPRETAVKETQARAYARIADAKWNEAMANINRMNLLLPGEYRGQALDLVTKAYQGKLSARNMEYLENYGFTPSELGAMGKEVFDTIKFGLGVFGAQKFQTPIINAIEKYNSQGEFTGATKLIRSPRGSRGYKRHY